MLYLLFILLHQINMYDLVFLSSIPQLFIETTTATEVKNTNMWMLAKTEMVFYVIFSALVLFNFCDFHSVNGIRSLTNTYELNTISVSCPFSTEFLVNVTCYYKRINRTSENNAVDIIIKPNVTLNRLFVRKHFFFIFNSGI